MPFSSRRIYDLLPVEKVGTVSTFLKLVWETVWERGPEHLLIQLVALILASDLLLPSSFSYAGLETLWFNYSEQWNFRLCWDQWRNEVIWGPRLEANYSQCGLSINLLASALYFTFPFSIAFCTPKLCEEIMPFFPPGRSSTGTQLLAFSTLKSHLPLICVLSAFQNVWNFSSVLSRFLSSLCSWFYKYLFKIFLLTVVWEEIVLAMFNYDFTINF